MAWKQPKYASHEYNLAGKALVNGGDLNDLKWEDALQIINNWRSAHYHPLNTFQLRLRRKANEIDGNNLVAQRIKRLSSIKHKLERFPSMRLTQIQDIGGCRAIVSTVDHLDKLVSVMSSRDKNRSSRGLKHKLIKEHDYVKNPKSSGYRGVHLIFEYHSDKVKEYENLKIEIQFRTLIQHSWATAVETVGAFIGQALKSSMGEQEWLRFFSLVSSAMAAYEGTTLVPGIDLSPDELRAELRRYASDLDVIGLLRSYSHAMNVMDVSQADAHYYLVKRDTDTKSVQVTSYKSNQFEKAAIDYLSAEKEAANKNIDAVLVSADSITALKKAYPNYFVDTELFIGQLTKIIA